MARVAQNPAQRVNPIEQFHMLSLSRQAPNKPTRRALLEPPTASRLTPIDALKSG
jgi:hypothetical protein